MSYLINGFEAAEKIRQDIKNQVIALKTDKRPRLDVIVVGSNPASAIYVKNKYKATTEVGMISQIHSLPETVSQNELLVLVDSLNQNPDVTGILVQLPLPKHIDENSVTQSILPYKDVDGFHPTNLGKLMIGEHGLRPCTPKGCIHLIHSVLPSISTLNAVVVGRSTIVGKPMSMMLLNENATVTIAHSKTQNLQGICKQADILIVAIGKPCFITRSFVKEDAIVIDVGINRLENGKLCGDVDFASVFDHCKALTPVPKGVGPMTIAMLLKNTLEAFLTN